MTREHSASSSKKIFLNVLLVLIAAFVLYQLFGLTIPLGNRNASPQAASPSVAPTTPNVVQVDVQNGCGASGIGQKMTALLRAAGYDVVEMGNYKTFDVSRSLVVDRSGNLELARRIASDLGISQKNVIQEISPEYFVAASVIVGKDFKSLRGWK